MQCRVLLVFFVSCLTLAISAAPVPDSSKGLHILDRALAPESAELEVARAPEPDPGCKMYSCI